MGAPTLPLHPKHPDRVCWGCERYCPADDMVCGNGTIRCPHPCELFGEDWLTSGVSSACPDVVDARQRTSATRHSHTTL
jgi:hypothetical protein